MADVAIIKAEPINAEAAALEPFDTDMILPHYIDDGTCNRYSMWPITVNAYCVGMHCDFISVNRWHRTALNNLQHLTRGPVSIVNHGMGCSA
jgi:hypothetical protein